jgi:hypothetical protein
LDALRELHATGRVHIVGLDKNEAAILVGFSRDTYLYLYPKATYGAVFDLYRTQGTRFPLGSTGLWRRMRDAGVATDFSDGQKRTKRIRRDLFEREERQVELI